MTPEEETTIEDEFECSKKALEKSSVDLNNLADYCESRFKGPEILPERPVTIENASKINYCLI